ncbi:hypothetical protein [Ruminiclostridium cellobioparum]|uniref:RES domain-containing protein n=1 Tax=Ruminiclostridium cellobioparum subsp. termitidis CT1112 TaxID=1195236 RepID=S0FI65_RUMCE|nr:hypothetical protein [Ruminiclostridium cellobioparum]EMS71287.1 hypothetical protein CTER_2875 [Ruminiclostridium cellobioparum subsp. termitidis CT1112]
MVINIDKPDFIRIMGCNFLDLPQRWDGKDFYITLTNLFNKYLDLISHFKGIDIVKIQNICDCLLRCIECYHKGFPSKAYIKMNETMKVLGTEPLRKYNKTGIIDNDFEETLNLYRIRNIQPNIKYERKDIFHTPYNLRSKVASCRYSISGYPSLYLGTSIKLCCEETKISSLNDLTIAALFRFDRNIRNNGNLNIEVIELGIKPSDFIVFNRGERYKTDSYADAITIDKRLRRDHLDEIDLTNPLKMISYLYWYPLIAACSFIRVCKSDPFASEYIIPQLLMQWVRAKVSQNKLVGIRYFSCASIRASEFGFNYVFPVSGKEKFGKENYCSVLRRAFILTMPRYIYEYSSIKGCEEALHGDLLDRI